MAKHGATLHCDGICAARTEAQCDAAKHVIISDLGEAGFILSIPKCVLDPIQRGDWLGFILDLGVGSFYVPSGKISRLQSSVASLNLNGPI